MGSLLPVLLVLILIFFAMKTALATAKKQKQAAAEIGAMLGLTLVDELASGEWAASLRKQNKSAGDQNLERAMKSWAGPYLAAMAPWRLEGDYNGAKVSVRKVEHGGGKSKQIYTRYQVLLRQPLGFPFLISSEGYLDRIGKSFFGLQDIESGNPELDRLIRVKSNHPNEAIAWLSSAGRQQALIELFTRYSDAEINETVVLIENKGFEPELKEYQEVLGSLSRVWQQL